MIKFLVILTVCLSNLLAISCSKSKKFEDRFAGGLLQGSSSIKDPFAFYGEEISPAKEQELLAENVIYFGYDKDEITDRYQLVLLAHAKQMIENPRLKLRINGHTDERGSAEYNVGLGERRAKAVARFMESKGVYGNKLVIVSYGKEKPVAMGSNEEAWRLNRRAELVYEE